MDQYGFDVKVIADSVAHGTSRLTTFQLRYPRLIHSEFMTHRVFSRNASSSRAIPVAKMLQQVREQPAMPVHWGKNQSGMQAREELTGWAKEDAITNWKRAAADAADWAESLQSLDVHKQVANRLLEPFQFISVVVTASEWDNFFTLRAHPDADPNINHLATMMLEAYRNSAPNALSVEGKGKDAFHLPYIQDQEWERYSYQALTQFSVARCARVSYLTHDGENPNPDKDIELYDRLVGGSPIHASPAEHQARPNVYLDKGVSGNFNIKWSQFRKYLETGDTQLFWES